MQYHSSLVPLSLLVLVLAVATTASQLSWSLHSDTLVDVLNRDQDYSLLLALLQQTRLIPTLNKLNGSTFFAPTNEAIQRRANTSVLWHTLVSESFLAPDNVHEQLRQQLFYHLLNYSLPDRPEDSSVQTLQTLHFPQPLLDSPPHDPPPFPFPIPHGLLGDEPQRLRLASRDGSIHVGVDASGNGGVKIVKQRVEATNGVVYGIADMLDPPPDLMSVVSGLKSLSYFHKVSTTEMEQFLNSTPELTLFMPLDAAWESLDPLERLYLESDFAANDLRRILDMHVVSESGVKWSDSLLPKTELTTRYGSALNVSVTPAGTTISGAKLVDPDVYASNGVLHLMSSLLIPPGALQLTPEKYLLALNCTSFVSLLHSVDLVHLINNTDKQFTILAPKDDVLPLFASSIPESGSPDLKRVLQYHFLPGLWKPSKLDDGMLLETELRELGLDDGRQVIHVDVNDGGKTDTERHITFGGAGVIGEHVEINNTIIYFMSRPLEPPVDPLQTALPSLDLSSFLAAVFSTSLADVIKKMPRTTFLIPHNSAFKRLGLLVSDHLLSASSKKDLENVILHHIINDIQYTKSLVDGSQRTFATLEGSDLQLERSEGKYVTVSASGGWAGMKSALYPQNTLTNTGVIHEVSDLMIPRSVELTVGKLMKAGKAATMTNVMAKAGFEWILDGTPPPEGSEWADLELGGATWTLLCPTDDAFKKHNLTQLLGNTDELRAIVRQHLILILPSPSSPVGTTGLLNNSRPLPLDRLGNYRTLLSQSSAYGDIVFKEMEDKTTAEYMVGIKDARGTDGKTDWARVLSWGRTTTGSGTGGVIQIDQLLLPYYPSWWIAYGAPCLVGVIGVLLICLFFYGVRIVWKRDQTEATYEPIGGFGRDCDES